MSVSQNAYLDSWGAYALGTKRSGSGSKSTPLITRPAPMGVIRSPRPIEVSNLGYDQYGVLSEVQSMDPADSLTVHLCGLEHRRRITILNCRQILSSG